MRISDRLSLAAKGLRGRWAVLPAVGMAIAAFCLCFAGAVATSVEYEKSQPYELNVTAVSGSLKDSDIATIRKLQDVTDATAQLDIPATVTVGEYVASFTLTGIDAAYLRDKFAQGSVFPDNGVMPYIVLNKAALKQFSKNAKTDEPADDEIDGEMSDETETPDETEAPGVDWLNAATTVQCGEGGKAIVSRICGILKGETKDQESAAYISLSAAKALLQDGGQIPAYTGAHVRVINIGAAEAVSREISKMGLSVENNNGELQSKWDSETKEMAYLIVIGVFCLLCAAVLLAAWRRISLLESIEVYQTLLCLGLLRRDIGRNFVMQSLMISLIGAASGVLLSLLLPSFLTAGETVGTIFLLPVPIGVILVSAGTCVLAGVISTNNSKKQCY